MKISTVIGGAIVFVAGIGAGMCLTCKAATKIDEKIYNGKLREKFVDTTADVATSFFHKKFEPKHFEPKKFEYTPCNAKYEHIEPKDIIFETRSEAEQTLLNLNDIIGNYGQASIADLYDLVGCIPVYTDNKFGWKEGLSHDLIFSDECGNWHIDFPEVCRL